MSSSMIGLSDEAPEVVRRYFEHDANRDIASIVALFAEDAIVVDEGHTRHGTADLRWDFTVEGDRISRLVVAP